MASEVGICSNALRKLGDDPITSLTDDTERARLCNAFYTDARDAVLNIQDALFRDFKINSTVSSKGKTLDVPLPSDGKKPQVIRIAVRQPSIKGSGGGSEVTRIGESAQCYYLALRFYHPKHSLRDLTCGCDTILEKEDFIWAQKYVDTNATKQSTLQSANGNTIVIWFRP